MCGIHGYRKVKLWIKYLEKGSERFSLYCERKAYANVLMSSHNESGAHVKLKGNVSGLKYA